MVREITWEQERQISAWAERWAAIGLSTEPADFDRATEAALKAYQLCNLGRPAVILRMGSPYGAIVGGVAAWMYLLEMIRSQRGPSQAWARTAEEVKAQLACHVEPSTLQWILEQAMKQIQAQVGDRVESRVRLDVSNKIEENIWKEIWGEIRAREMSQVAIDVVTRLEFELEGVVKAYYAQVYSLVGTTLYSQIKDLAKHVIHNLYPGAFKAAECSRIAFLRDVMGWADPVLDRFKIQEDLTTSCAGIWLHDNVLAIGDRPREIHLDDQRRPHREDGPAILYSDGWGVYAIRGHRVPDYVVAHPELITTQDIQAERNEAVRGIMAERMVLSRQG
jgi:hypothetical protein